MSEDEEEKSTLEKRSFEDALAHVFRYFKKNPKKKTFWGVPTLRSPEGSKEFPLTPQSIGVYEAIKDDLPAGMSSDCFNAHVRKNMEGSPVRPVLDNYHSRLATGTHVRRFFGYNYRTKTPYFSCRNSCSCSCTNRSGSGSCTNCCSCHYMLLTQQQFGYSPPKKLPDNEWNDGKADGYYAQWFKSISQACLYQAFWLTKEDRKPFW